MLLLHIWQLERAALLLEQGYPALIVICNNFIRSLGSENLPYEILSFSPVLMKGLRHSNAFCFALSSAKAVTAYATSEYLKMTIAKPS